MLRFDIVPLLTQRYSNDREQAFEPQPGRIKMVPTRRRSVQLSLEVMEERKVPALAIAGPGLVNVAAAIDRVEVLKNVDVDIPITIQNNEIAVVVAALGSAVGVNQ